MDFFFLGNTSFSGLYQREHAFAITLARRGYDVTYVEGMPSVASKIRSFYRSEREHGMSGEGPPHRNKDNIRILTPPVVPTFFRSSWTPSVDRWLFRRWFNRQFAQRDWSSTILMVMFPYWWYGFADRRLCPARLVVYDVCDALQVPSRNSKTLTRMIEAENALLGDADLVTYSAREMIHSLQTRKRKLDARFVSNAVPVNFAGHLPRRRGEGSRQVIGYIGSLDERWVNTTLLLKTAERFPNSSLVIVSPMHRKLALAVRRHKNIEFLPPIPHERLGELFAAFDVALIPFRKNEITRVGNPLKLYEYCSAGLPIVSTKTDELSHYSDLIYLSETDEEFLTNVQIALDEADVQKRDARTAFARANTWDARVDTLLEFVEERLKAQRSPEMQK